ncbi:MAG: hypothetical protein P4L53_23300 [Candidatus Obscuribacterales bacterium]|nr:hypothetical protein [Candidatus Obscuribacterales bacterium]
MMTRSHLEFPSNDHVEEPRLGAFLEQYGFLEHYQLENVVSNKHPIDFPIGMRLVRSGYVQENLVRACVHAQSLLKDGVVPEDQLHRALTLVKKRGMSLGNSLRRLGYVIPKTAMTYRLGQLLVSSGIIDSITLTKALGLSRLSGLPLGRVLTCTGEISPTFLNFALTTQIKVRNGTLDRQSAAASLGRIQKYSDADDFSQTLKCDDANLIQPPLLGRLLVHAQALNDTEIAAALAISRAHDMMLGQVLIDYSWLDRSIVTRALQVQRLIAQSAVSSTEANCILQQAVAGPVTRPFSVVVDNQLPRKNSLSDLQFLSMVGVITPEIIEKSLQIALRHPRFLERLNELAHNLGKIKIGEEERINFTLADFPLLSIEMLNAVTVEPLQKESLMNAIRVAMSNDVFVHKVIDFARIVTPQTIALALQIKRLFCNELVDLDQAMILLNYCGLLEVDAIDGCHRLGWSRLN